MAQAPRSRPVSATLPSRLRPCGWPIADAGLPGGLIPIRKGWFRPEASERRGKGPRGLRDGFYRTGEGSRPPVGSISAMNTTSIVRNIRLDHLVLSPANVRKSPASAAEDAELKASIRAGGLKQNLIVCPVADEPECFAVTAGGRRLKALHELAAEGAIANDCEVPCLIEQPNAAIETS